MRKLGTGLRTVAAVALMAAGLAACGGSTGADGGDAAPAFALPDAAGGTVALADYGDEPVLLYFHMAEG